MDGVSEELKKAMTQIDKIIKRFDINACIFLADGKGNGEFKNYAEEPTWSMIRFLSDKGDGKRRMHLKSHTKTKPEESNRTVNSLYVLRDMVGQMFLREDQMIKEIEKRIEIQKEEGKIISHEDYLSAKEKKDKK